MRYHFEEGEITVPVFGKLYYCDHPLYSECTLYKIGKRGLAVIQQKQLIDPDSIAKATFWGAVHASLWNAIYISPKFKEYFDKYAAEPDENGLYPTVTVRQIMWALRMKPLKKERWETVFDRCPI